MAKPPRSGSHSGGLPPRVGGKSAAESRSTPNWRTGRRQPGGGSPGFWIAAAVGSVLLVGGAVAAWWGWRNEGQEAEAARSAGTIGEWQTLALPESGFRVDLPGTPERQPQLEEPGYEVYALYGGEPETGYVVRYMTVPDKVTRGKTTARLLDAAVTTYYGKARIVSANQISRDGRFGREVRLERDDGTCVSQIFIDGGNLASAEIIWRSTEEPRDLYDRMFKSIRFETRPTADTAGRVFSIDEPETSEPTSPSGPAGQEMRPGPAESGLPERPAEAEGSDAPGEPSGRPAGPSRRPFGPGSRRVPGGPPIGPRSSG